MTQYHHALVGLPFVLVEHGVAVVGSTFDDGCFAGATGAFGAGGQHSDACLFDDGEDGFAQGNGETEFALREVDLEGFREAPAL